MVVGRFVMEISFKTLSSLYYIINIKKANNESYYSNKCNRNAEDRLVLKIRHRTFTEITQVSSLTQENLCRCKK